MPSTWLLWLGPFVLFVVGFAALWRAMRRQGRAQSAPLTPAERERADALLRGDPP
jgi:cytochrome c-type biogenesis protein CcmH